MYFTLKLSLIYLQITVNRIAILHSIMITDTTRNCWRLHLFNYGQCFLKVKWMFCGKTQEDKSKTQSLLPQFQSQVKVYLSISNVQVTSTGISPELVQRFLMICTMCLTLLSVNLCSNKNTWRVASMLKKEVYISWFYLCVLNKIS